MRGRIYAVHYGEDTEVTKQLLASLQLYLNADRQLVLINNDRQGLFDSWLLPFVTVMEPASNIGYFPAISWAMERYPVKDLDYVMVCNNDIVFQSTNFFRVLEEKLQDWDVVAPSTKTLDGVEQNPHRQSKPSQFRKVYYRFYFASYIFAWIVVKILDWKHKKKAGRTLEPTEQAVFSPHGACIVLKNSYFKKGGVIDNRCFLYAEEDSIASFSASNQLKVGFVPELKIVHQESKSTGKSISRKKYGYQKEAYRYIKRNYPNIY
jgi:GT2 family glycosyltransferase